MDISRESRISRMTRLYVHFADLNFANFANNCKIIIFFLVDFIVFAKIDFFGGGFKISRDFNFANSSLVRISRTLNFANFREFCLISRINAREIQCARKFGPAKIKALLCTECHHFSLSDFLFWRGF